MSRALLRREIRLSLPGAPADRRAAAGFAALSLFLLAPAVFGGQALFIRDIGMVWYPQIESFVRSVTLGSWPLWDVYRGFGQPILADPTTQVLYPLTWLNVLMRPWHYYTLFAAFHLVVASFGTYLLARRWGCSPGAAFVAGAVWCVSGPLLSLVCLWHHFSGAAWIPWVLLLADVALASGRLSHAVAWGVVAALQVLAGSADMVAMTGLGVLVYALAHHVRWRLARAINWRLARSTLLAMLVALGLSAALWLPVLGFARGSARMHLSAAERTTWSLHPAGLLGIVCLIHWGDVPPLTKDAASLRDLQGPFLYSVYLGGPAAALVAAALAGRARRAAFLACLGLGTLLLALGRHTFVYDAAMFLLPPFKIFRFPVKWMILVALAWSLLAGIGYDVWRTAATRKDLRWMLGVVAPLALASALMLGGALVLGGRQGYGSLPGALGTGGGLLAAAALFAVARSARTRLSWAVAPALAILVVAELAVRQRDIQAFAPRQLFTHRPEVLDVLGDTGYARLYVYDYSVAAYPGQQEGRERWGYRLAKAPQGFSKSAATALGVQMYLNPPTAGRWGRFGSFDVDLLALSPEPLRRLSEELRRSEGAPSHLRLLRIGGVRDVLALHRESWWNDLVPVGSVPGLLVEPIQVLRVPDTLPRAYAVSGVRIADGESAIAALGDQGFDPSREVILPAGAPRAAAASFRGQSRITSLEPDHVQVEVDLSEAGHLVLLDSYDRGWRVSVDGQSAGLLRANVAFRGVAVPAGRHRVDFVYRPKEVIGGLLVSASTATALIGMAVLRRGRTGPAAVV